LDATNGLGHPVTVTADVLEGLEAVWFSGETDMGDTRAVQTLAFRMGYPYTTWWLEFSPTCTSPGWLTGSLPKSRLSPNSKEAGVLP
jgi:hypothetical protein